MLYGATLLFRDRVPINLARDLMQLRKRVESSEAGKLLDIDFVGAAGFGVGDVGEPFQLGRHIGELSELRRR